MGLASVKQLLSQLHEYLRNNSHNLQYHEPLLESKILLTHATGLTMSQLISHDDKIVTADIENKIWAMAKRRVAGEPIAYITLSQPFWTLDLEVSTETLIPRADTEALVEHVLSLPLPATCKTLDLGTGTGAIALSLASERPTWHVSACDFKQTIVDLALRNAARSSIAIQCFVSDWFSQVGDSQYNLIVSNPPYVEPNSEYLSKGDLRFEPMTALTAQNEGFADIEKIIHDAHKYLEDSGFLVFEHGYQQSQRVGELLASAGYTKITPVNDLNGHPRVTSAQLYK